MDGMNILLTGGAGFIGRWVLKTLLDKKHNVWVVDDLSNGRMENIEAFQGNKYFKKVFIHDIKDEIFIHSLFSTFAFDVCFHLGASINVQDSIDHPRPTFENDTVATFHLLEACRRKNVKMVFMSTCMVYDRCEDAGITEKHPTKPASPYAGAKIAAENMVLSYYYAYQLPVVVLRPFNTYGPFQKAGGEGGVVSIFLKKKIQGGILNVYGEGTQTRDLLYVEDCADFVVGAGLSSEGDGHILHAGTGRDVSINELAQLVMNNPKQIEHVPHIHPQSEVMKLLCDYTKATTLLGWQPKVTLEEGLEKTEQWMRENQERW